MEGLKENPEKSTASVAQALWIWNASSVSRAWARSKSSRRFLSSASFRSSSSNASMSSKPFFNISTPFLRSCFCIFRKREIRAKASASAASAWDSSSSRRDSSLLIFSTTQISHYLSTRCGHTHSKTSGNANNRTSDPSDNKSRNDQYSAQQYTTSPSQHNENTEVLRTRVQGCIPIFEHDRAPIRISFVSTHD